MIPTPARLGGLPPFGLAAFVLVVVGHKYLGIAIQLQGPQKPPLLCPHSTMKEQRPALLSGLIAFRRTQRQHNAVESVTGQMIEPGHLAGTGSGLLEVPTRQKDAERTRPRVVVEPTIGITPHKTMDIELPTQQGEQVVALQVTALPVIDVANRQEAGKPVKYFGNHVIAPFAWWFAEVDQPGRAIHGLSQSIPDKLLRLLQNPKHRQDMMFQAGLRRFPR